MSDCIFCDIISGRTRTEFLYSDESVVVFNDIHPQAPVHLLIVPRQHIRSINDLADADAPVLQRLIQVAQKMADDAGVAASGYKLLFNVERGGGQVIFHLHLHLIGGWGLQTG
jgi:histidine triad (HIT) family protein